MPWAVAKGYSHDVVKDIPDRFKPYTPRLLSGKGRFGTIVSGITTAGGYAYKHRKAILSALGIATGTGVAINLASEGTYRKTYRPTISGYSRSRRNSRRKCGVQCCCAKCKQRSKRRMHY